MTFWESRLKPSRHCGPERVGLVLLCAVLAGPCFGEPSAGRVPATGMMPGLQGPYLILSGMLLAGAAVCWFRRRQPRLPAGAGQELTVTHRCRLSGKATLYVVRYRTREMVIVEHEHGVTEIGCG